MLGAYVLWFLLAFGRLATPGTLLCIHGKVIPGAEAALHKHEYAKLS